MTKRRHSAFSLVEVLLALSVAAILAFLAVVTVARLVNSTQEQKLTSDADTLNRAVMAYIASGGDMGGLKTADEVLLAMKRQSSSAERTPGLAGSLIDPRVSFVYETAGKVGSGGPRLYWNESVQRFEVSKDRQDPGIVSVSLDGAEPSTGGDAAERKNPLLYAKDGNWIWDYADAPLPAGKGPNEINVNPVPDTKVPPPPPEPPRTGTRPLDPPTFSIRGGDYPRADFLLSLRLADPNPAGAGQVFYSIDYGNWKPYSATISVPAGAVVAAQTVSLKEDFTSSARVEQTYRPIREALLAPSIQLSATEFTDTLDTIGIRLADPNPAGTSDLYFAFAEPGAAPGARSQWQLYKGDLVALSSIFPGGFTIHAYARARDTTAYLDSPSAQAEAGANFTFEDPGDGNVLYVIDASGSMKANVGSSTRFRLVQDALIEAIGRLRPGTRFNVVTFAGNSVWSNGTWDLALATDESKKEMIKQVNQFKTASGTNYEAALAVPLKFKTKPEKVYFLTDGEPTGGAQYLDDVAKLAASGIHVNTIGVDLKEASERRLEEIASLTGGVATMVSTK
jgi:prepilin-type N-terminal cleavage/methylation domain-containing protein